MAPALSCWRGLITEQHSPRMRLLSGQRVGWGTWSGFSNEITRTEISATTGPKATTCHALSLSGVITVDSGHFHRKSACVCKGAAEGTSVLGTLLQLLILGLDRGISFFRMKVKFFLK